MKSYKTQQPKSKRHFITLTPAWQILSESRKPFMHTKVAQKGYNDKAKAAKRACRGRVSLDS